MLFSVWDVVEFGFARKQGEEDEGRIRYFTEEHLECQPESPVPKCEGSFE